MYTVFVRHGLVFAGLIWTIEARFVTGISALATLELNGPITPSTLLSSTKAAMFWATLAGAWTPASASSRFFNSGVNPSTEQVSGTAIRTPCREGTWLVCYLGESW